MPQEGPQGPPSPGIVKSVKSSISVFKQACSVCHNRIALVPPTAARCSGIPSVFQQRLLAPWLETRDFQPLLPHFGTRPLTLSEQDDRKTLPRSVMQLGVLCDTCVHPGQGWE